jgi:hypothetical protein
MLRGTNTAISQTVWHPYPDTKMSPRTLAAKIRNLSARPRITTQFERILRNRGLWNRNGVWYTSQKEHWLGWLSQYDGPGYYKRKNHNHQADFAYNHINCPPMVLWLGEASGIPKAKILAAKKAALSASPALPAQSAAIRKVIPWELIEARLKKR